MSNPLEVQGVEINPIKVENQESPRSPLEFDRTMAQSFEKPKNRIDAGEKVSFIESENDFLRNLAKGLGKFFGKTEEEIEVTLKEIRDAFKQVEG